MKVVAESFVDILDVPDTSSYFNLDDIYDSISEEDYIKVKVSWEKNENEIESNFDIYKDKEYWINKCLWNIKVEDDNKD